MAGITAGSRSLGARTPRGLRAVLAVVCVFVVVAGLAVLIEGSPLSPPLSVASAPAVQLTAADDDGGNVAFVMGGSGIPLPSEGYVNGADLLYLQPHGFTGTAQSLFTPELYFPGNVSEVQGAQILADAIEKEIAGGGVSAENPVYVFGYSQSSAMSSMTMEQLHSQGVPADDVHFVMVGNSANPNGGIVEMLNIWGGDVSFWSGLTLGHPTPDYFTTDVYTMEYDGFADFPRYPLNLLADLNAIAGMFLLHDGYLGLSADDIAHAIPLETTGDTLTNYYMIPTDTLPLLDILRLNPVWGNPLADLLEPDMRILVNLGYGSITEGWNQGPANVPTAISFDLLPNDLNWGELYTALVNGWSQGVQAAIGDLQDPSNYVLGSFLNEEPYSTLWNAAQRVFFNDQDPTPFGGSAEATDSSDSSDFWSSLDSFVDSNPMLSSIADALGLDVVSLA